MIETSSIGRDEQADGLIRARIEDWRRRLIDLSWRNPLIFKHLVTLAKDGRIVMAKAGLRSWRIFADGGFQECA